VSWRASAPAAWVSSPPNGLEEAPPKDSGRPRIRSSGARRRSVALTAPVAPPASASAVTIVRPSGRTVTVSLDDGWTANNAAVWSHEQRETTVSGGDDRVVAGAGHAPQATIVSFAQPRTPGKRQHAPAPIGGVS
jgi:hypothetical protein